MNKKCSGVSAPILLLAAVSLLAACTSTPKSYIVLLDSPDAEGTGAVTVTNEDGARTLDQPGQFVGLNEDADVAPRQVDEDLIERDFAAALAVEPEEPRSFLLYFLTGGAELTAESQAQIPAVLTEVNRREAPEIAIIGHTDTAGSAEANAALALERANAIRDVVVEAGANPDLIEVTSHGESNLLIETEDDVDEPRNRRVEIVIR